MKKILLLFVAFFCNCIQVFSYDLKTFDIRETYFKNNISFCNRLESCTIKGDFAIKGIWADPKNLANRVMLEDILCDYDNLKCISNFLEIDFWGTSVSDLNPYVDIFNNKYQIIQWSKDMTFKLYSAQTEYVIEVDLVNKTANKYKVFPNGDVNKYVLLLDDNKIKKYLAEMIKTNEAD